MASEANSSTGSVKVEDWWSGLNALDYAGVVLRSVKTVAGIAPFGSQLQACINLAQAIVDNVKDMQTFRASEDDLTKRVADTLRIIAEALQKRNRRDAKQLKQDLHPLEIVMQDITVFTSKQKTKNSLQRFIDAGEDKKKVEQFNSDLNDNLLQLHMKLMLDVDSGVKSMQWAQKKRHNELMDELGQLRALVGNQKKPEDQQHNQNISDNPKKPVDRRVKNVPERPEPRKGRAPNNDPRAPIKDEKDGGGKQMRRKDEDLKAEGKAGGSKGPTAPKKSDNNDDPKRKPRDRGKADLKKSNNENEKNRERRGDAKDQGPPQKPTKTAPKTNLSKSEGSHNDRDESDRESVASSADSHIAVASRNKRDRKDASKEPAPRKPAQPAPKMDSPKGSRNERDNSDRESIASSVGSNVAVADRNRRDWKDDKRDGQQARGRGRVRGKGRGDAGRGGRRAPTQGPAPDDKKGAKTEENTNQRKESSAGQTLLGVDVSSNGEPRPRFPSQPRNERLTAPEANVSSWRRNSMSNFSQPWYDFHQGQMNPPFLAPPMSPMMPHAPWLPSSGAMFFAPQYIPTRSEGEILDVPGISVMNPDASSATAWGLATSPDDMRQISLTTPGWTNAPSK